MEIKKPSDNCRLKIPPRIIEAFTEAEAEQRLAASTHKYLVSNILICADTITESAIDSHFLKQKKNKTELTMYQSACTHDACTEKQTKADRWMEARFLLHLKFQT